MLLSQTIAVKRRENPEFFDRRYPTPEARTIIDARMNYSLSVGYTVSSNIVNNGVVIDCILSLPQVIPEEATEIHHFQENHVRGVMEKAILPLIPPGPKKQRIMDELPQSGSGKTIMTTQIKFVPSDGAAAVQLPDNASARVRMVDSVGYLVHT